MTREETIKILAVLKAAYPNFYKTMTKEEAEGTVQLWASMFIEEDYRLVSEAVRAHIATDEKGFPPIIGQIKGKVRQITQPQEMTELEAWGYVQKAVKNSGYYAKEEFEKLPETVKAVVGSPSILREWSMVDIKEFQTVIQSNFMRSYRGKVQAHKDYQALPQSVKNLMSEITGNFDMNNLLENKSQEQISLPF